MLARYLKAQLIVLLCGGLVGPIFLVVYFALGQGSLMQWMLYVGLLITVADVLIAFGWPTSARSRRPRRPRSSSTGCWRSLRSPGSPRRGRGSTSNRW